MTTPSKGQTPVEELIGWERFEGRWWDGERHRSHADVDDLAGWLRERCRSVEIAWVDDEDEPDVFWIAYVFFDAPTIRSAEFDAPTILAALETAVRAVHDEGEA